MFCPSFLTNAACRAGGGVINNRYFRYVGSDAAEATSLSIASSAITPESSNNLQDLVPFPYPPIAYSDPSSLNVSLNEPVNQYPGCDLSIQLPTASSTPVFSNSSGMMGLVSPAPQPHAGPSFYLSPFSRIAAEPSETIANAAKTIYRINRSMNINNIIDGTFLNTATTNIHQFNRT